MSAFAKAGSMAGGLVLSLVVTWFAWELFVEGRAYDCTDAGTLSLGPWTSIYTHESAGDRIQPGWTWERVILARRVCLLAFLALWFAGSKLVLRVIDHHEKTG